MQSSEINSAAEDCEFGNLSNLQDHEADKENSKNIECSICGKNFLTLGIHENHVVSIHEKKIEIFNCKNCPESFTTRRRLRKHLSKHHNGSGHVLVNRCSDDH